MVNKHSGIAPPAIGSGAGGSAGAGLLPPTIAARINHRYRVIRRVRFHAIGESGVLFLRLDARTQ